MKAKLMRKYKKAKRLCSHRNLLLWREWSTRLMCCRPLELNLHHAISIPTHPTVMVSLDSLHYNRTSNGPDPGWD